MKCATLGILVATCSLGIMSQASLTHAGHRAADSTITIDAPGWSLQKICESISTQIGQKVAAKGDCATDYLVVHVHNVTWPELQKKIAWAEYGQWTNLDGTLTISRDKAAVDAKLAANRADTIKEYDAQRAQQAKIAKIPFNALEIANSVKAAAKAEMNKHPDWYQGNNLGLQSAAENSLSQRTDCGMSTWANQLLISFLPEQLLAFPGEDRVVYSNHPTSLQHAYSEASLAVIQTAISQDNSLIKALNSVGIDRVENSMGNDFSGTYLPLEPLSADDTFILSLHRIQGILIGNLRVFNDNGILISSTRVLAGAPFQTRKPIGMEPSESKTVQLSPELVEWARLLRDPRSKHTDKDLEFITKLLQPEKYDILALFVDPALQQMAPGQNIVVSDDDLCIFLPEISDVHRGKVNVDFTNSELFKTDADGIQSDGWLAIRNNLLFENLSEKLERKSYQNLINSTKDADKDVYFTNLCKFALANPSQLITSFTIQPYWQLATGDGLTSGFFHASWALLRLIGSLNSDQLGRAESKRGLDLTQLLSEQRPLLNQALLSSFSGDPAQTEANPLGSGKDKITILDEPTVAFAESMPAGVLTLNKKIDDEVGYMMVLQGHTNPMYTMGPANTFGDVLTEPTGENLPSFDPNHFRWDVKYAYTGQLEFDLKGQNPLSFTWTFSETDHKDYSNWHDLPARIVKEVEDGMPKQNEAGKAGSGGGS